MVGSLNRARRWVLVAVVWIVLAAIGAGAYKGIVADSHPGPAGGPGPAAGPAKDEPPSGPALPAAHWVESPLPASVKAVVQFGRARPELDSDGRANLELLCAYLETQGGMQLVVSGQVLAKHTPDDMDLARKRAENVLKFLTGEASKRVDPKRIRSGETIIGGEIAGVVLKALVAK